MAPIHPDIFSDAALRHVRRGADRPPGEMTAAELPPMAASWASTEKVPVGAWKDRRPRYVRGLSPCLTHCPVGNDVEGFISRLRDGDEEGAARLLAAENPLPATCGRVCYHPCETGCNRVKLDGSVGIRAIERYLGDLPLFDDASLWQPDAPSRDKRIAVVGSGPGGLSCAWVLALLGYPVTVHERRPLPGGLLRYGIPAYRLPKEVLDREIGRMSDLGVRFEYGVDVGEARSLSSLLERYDAVFVATGASTSRSLPLDGDTGGLCINSLDFLTALQQKRPIDPGKHCVVVGGGNSAVDAARSARRLGAEVTILYRRTRAEMPAFGAEIDDALAEGVILVELAIPKELKVRNGRLEALVCLRTRLGEPDASGRRSPVPIPDSEFTLPATAVINALGEQVDAGHLAGEPEMQAALHEISEWGRSPLPNLFAGGDFAGGERTVAHAIGGGKRAAMAIDRFLKGDDRETLDRFRVGGGPASLAGYLRRGGLDILQEDIHVVTYEDLNPAYFPQVERLELQRHLNREPSADFAEVEEGLDAARARAEAARCFSCGRCTRCGLCQIFCPEGAVRPDPETGEYFIYDAHCKGCGICVEECPRCAIRMEPVDGREE